MRTVFPPGPEGHFLLGNYAQMQAGMVPFLRTLQSYGDIVHYRVGPLHFYAVFHPDYIYQVFVGDADKFHKAKLLKAVLKPFAGNGVILADGEHHRRQRRLMQPAFHHKRIESYAQAMVDCTMQMMDRWPPNAEINIDQEMMHVALRIVARTLFNVDVGDKVNDVEAAMGTLQEVISAQLRRRIPISLPPWIPSARQRKKKAAIDALHTIIKRLIAERRASGEDKGDLLSMLLLATDETDGSKMTNEEAVHEAVTLFIAGYETTAGALSWAWYLLATNPEVEAKLLTEVREVLEGRLPTVQDLPKLKYTAAVVKETLRVYPPVWSTNRQAIAEVNIGGFTVPKGAVVFVAPFLTHSDPRFYDQPECFMPERFVGEAEKQIPRFAYYPFGGGPRICIGQQFALMEATLILATVVQQYQLNLVPDQVIEPTVLLTIRPKNGVRVLSVLRERVAQPTAQT
jgi:cytochrome P450